VEWLEKSQRKEVIFSRPTPETETAGAPSLFFQDKDERTLPEVSAAKPDRLRTEKNKTDAQCRDERRRRSGIGGVGAELRYEPMGPRLKGKKRRDTWAWRKRH
jgi:hypothetical protein